MCPRESDIALLITDFGCRPLQGGGSTGFDAGAFVQILPFRSRNIFSRDRLSDAGAQQFYDIGLENIVSEKELTGADGGAGVVGSGFFVRSGWCSNLGAQMP